MKIKNIIMKHTDYVKTDIWYAWYPVRTNEGWVWLQHVKRTIDERPLVYQGLLEITTYEVLL